MASSPRRSALLDTALLPICESPAPDSDQELRCRPPDTIAARREQGITVSPQEPRLQKEERLEDSMRYAPRPIALPIVMRMGLFLFTLLCLPVVAYPQTWSEPIPIDTLWAWPTLAADLCADREGKMWVAFSAEPVWASYFVESTETWSPWINVNDTFGYGPPAMTLDGAGRLWIGWSGWAWRQGIHQVDVFARYCDGLEWSPVMVVDSFPSMDYVGGMTTDGEGRAWMCWSTTRSGVQDIAASHYDEYTQRWSDPMKVVNYCEDDAARGMTTDSLGRLWIAGDRTYWTGHWDSWAYVCIYENGQWVESPLGVSDTAKTVGDIVTDGEGRVWAMVGIDSVPSGPYMTYFENGHWSPFIQVTDDPSAEDHCMGVDKRGKVWIAFQAGSYSSPHVYSTFFDGERWTTPVQVTADSILSANPYALAADSSGMLHLCWGGGNMWSNWCDPNVGVGETRIWGSLAPGPVVEQNRPNPFRTSTDLRFSLDRPNRVEVKIYNLAGQLVRSLLDMRIEAGSRTCTWNGRADAGGVVESGVYLCRLHIGSRSWVLRLVKID